MRIAAGNSNYPASLYAVDSKRIRVVAFLDAGNAGFGPMERIKVGFGQQHKIGENNRLRSAWRDFVDAVVMEVPDLVSQIRGSRLHNMPTVLVSSGPFRLFQNCLLEQAVARHGP